VSWRSLIARIGSVIFVFGVLVLLFVAYQLWGTSITTRFHQEALRKQFDRELAVARKDRTTTTIPSTQLSAPTSTTTTTQPLRGVAAATPGVAPANGQPIGTIVIPTIGANFVVVQGTDTGDLELGPGHYANTPLPGQPGNSAIAGHRTTYLHPFYNLNELAAGDRIYITTTQGRFQYDVTSVSVVSPSDVAVLDPTASPTLTLTTCNPRYSASQRLVVQASLVSVPAPVPTTTTTVPASKTPRSRHPSATNTGLAGTTGSVWPTVGLGVAAAAFAAAVWLAMRRWRRWPARLALGTVGTLLFLTLLFFFFQSITPLLPASF
jgi:sortase A